jgi:hypothetical protein
MRVVYLDWYSHCFRFKVSERKCLPPFGSRENEGWKYFVPTKFLYLQLCLTICAERIFAWGPLCWRRVLCAFFLFSYCVFFATKRLACNATPTRETHCRTRSCSNRVKYYSFWAVFWQRKILPGLVLAPRCDAGFRLYEWLKKTKFCTRQFPMSILNQRRRVFDIPSSDVLLQKPLFKSVDSSEPFMLLRFEIEPLLYVLYGQAAMKLAL